MSEFKYTSPNPLEVPDKCQDCPAICIVKNEADERNAEIERDVRTALLDDEDKHATRQRLLAKYVRSTPPTELFEPLEKKRKRLSKVLDEQEEDMESDQFDIGELTEECEGPIVLEGVSPLGRHVVATVCGSEAYDSNTDRFFVGPGHGQAQHEQVHIERQLKPNEI